MAKKVLFTANLESFFTKFLIPQLKYFKDNGYEVHIATKLENLDIPYCDKKIDVNFARGFNLKQNIESYKQMKKVFMDNHYDIVSCHTPFGGAITRLAFKNLKIKNTKMVYMAHGFHFYKGAPLLNWLLYYNAEKYLAKYTDDLITMNLDDYEIAKEKFKTNVHYVKGVGLDTNKFDFEMSLEEKNNFRKSLGLKENDFVLTYVAEYTKEKRQLWLIDTLIPILKEHKNMKLLLPGRDSLNGILEQTVKDLNLEKQVKILGFRTDIPKILKISNLAVSTSSREGLPLNIIEAMYCGLPIVATACRGNRDLICNNKNGYIVDINNKEQFRKKVLYFYNTSNEKLESIKNEDKKIIEQYLLKNVIEQIANVYKQRKQIIYLRATSVINDSRASKEIKCYLEAGYDVTVLGWNRQNLKDLNIQVNNNLVRIITYEKPSDYGSGMKNIFKLLGFQIWLHKKLKQYKNNYSIIHACDFDTAYVSSKIAKKYNKKFVYDIYDYYVHCHGLGFLKSIVEKMDINCINKSDVTIICTEQRKKQISKAKPKKLIIVHNTPEIDFKLNEYKFNKDKIKVCYVGILQDDRLLVEITEQIKNTNLEFHIGGFGKYENYFKEMSLKYDNIKFYGQMKYEEVLKLESKCDILFATYNPEIKNHTFSAPNKLYEAMALGKPIIVCKNTGIDDIVKKEKIGFVINYSANEFIECINKISTKQFNEISSKTQKIYNNKYSWQKMKEMMLKTIK